MGIGQSAGDLVSAWITRCYSKLRFALSRRHSSSPAASAATNNDVPATSCWRSSHVVCDALKGSLLETAISQLTSLLRYRGNPSLAGVPVPLGVGPARTPLWKH